jgi:hypothetical protein
MKITMEITQFKHPHDEKIHECYDVTLTHINSLTEKQAAELKERVCNLIDHALAFIK